MAFLQEQALWVDDIYQLEQTDLVLAGPNGIANQQAKELANRTSFLKSELYKIGRFSDAIEITGSIALDATDITKLIALERANANVGAINITLPALSDVAKGFILPFVSTTENGLPFKISGPDFIKIGRDIKTEMFMHDEEIIWLVADPDNTVWRTGNIYGNFLNIGNPFYGYKQQKNTLVRAGQTVRRADFPRLWEWVQTLRPETFIQEWQWLQNIAYCGCFSNGDGVETFRLPDDRGMFERALDLGRGIDIDRNWNYAGGYEKDEIISHDHKSRVKSAGSEGGSRWGWLPGNPNENGSNGQYDIITYKSGGNETRPKNIGKIPLINY